MIQSPFLHALLSFIFFTLATFEGYCQPSSALAMVGTPKLSGDWRHFPYAFYNAPKGGDYKEAILGSFDSLNPFIVRGIAAEGVRFYVFESLMARNKNEPFSLYGLIAEKVEVSPDEKSVTFFLNPKARFSDGRAISTQDVEFSYKILTEYGRPNFRNYYRRIVSTMRPSPQIITFHFKEKDRELPLILGLMPILPHYFFQEKTFDKPSLKPMIGSGPYRISEVIPGQKIVYAKNQNYWGKDLPVNRGLWNFNRVIFEYYGTEQAAYDAFMRGDVDLRFENDASRWATGYQKSVARQNERIIRETPPVKIPQPAASLVLNTRRPLLKDIRTRKALSLLMNFSWINKNLYFGLMDQVQGFFSHSPLSAVGQKITPDEEELLKKWHVSLESPFLLGTWQPHLGTSSGYDRRAQQEALDLFQQSGFEIKDGTLISKKTQKPLVLEILFKSREQEKIAIAYQRFTKPLGIELRLRRVDTTQYEQRLKTFDFDMMFYTWSNSLSPGHEQAFYWGCQDAHTQGGRNYPGVCKPEIDRVISLLENAQKPEEIKTYARLLDRFLLAGFYVIPLLCEKGLWVARWSSIQSPTPSFYGLDREALWREEKR